MYEQAHAIMHIPRSTLYFTAGDDFFTTNPIVLFPPGTPPGIVDCFQVLIVPDSVVEGTESFTLLLRSLQVNVDPARSIIEVTILDGNHVFSSSQI